MLLSDPDYTHVVSFVRRSAGIAHPKLTEHIIDFSELDNFAAFMHGDIWFSCLGTTLKSAGSKDQQWRITARKPSITGSFSREK